MELDDRKSTLSACRKILFRTLIEFGESNDCDINNIILSLFPIPQRLGRRIIIILQNLIIRPKNDKLPIESENLKTNCKSFH